MRHLLALTLILPAAGCGTFASVTPFRTVDDLQTTRPRSLAEGGHSAPVEAPAGVDWSVELSGRKEDPHKGVPASYYDVRLTLFDRVPDAEPGRLRLALDGAALVDDEGRSFTPSRVSVVQPKKPRPREPGQPPPPQVYVLRFDVPLTYHFGHVSHLTFHWGLKIEGGRVLRISTRFRP